MRIGIVLRGGRPEQDSPVMAEMIRRLSGRGVAVDAICPEERLTDLSRLRVERDLYVLKHRSELALSLAGALHAVGARILNSGRVSEMLRNKIVATQMLEAAGVPVPESYLAHRPDQLAHLLRDGPLVIKPYRGSRGRGIRVVRAEGQLDLDSFGERPIFAQRYKEPDGRDRKIYCIGDHIFGVKRVWPAHTLEQKVGEPFEVTAELCDITRRCGNVFGIDLFGIDVIISGGRAYVVDASSFPGFKGVPDAAQYLADYIYAYAAGKRAEHGEPHLRAVQGGGRRS